MTVESINKKIQEKRIRGLYRYRKREIKVQNISFACDTQIMFLIKLMKWWFITENKIK